MDQVSGFMISDKRIVESEYTNSHIKLHKYSEINDLGIFVKFNMRIGILYNAFRPQITIHQFST